jgi:hypothetical protein
MLLIFIQKSSSVLNIMNTERDFFCIELLFSYPFFYFKKPIIFFMTIIDWVVHFRLERVSDMLCILVLKL